MLDGLDVDRWPVELVVSEAVANAVVHAYPDRAPGQVRLEAWLEDELLTLSWPTMGWECRRGVIVLASARVWRSFAV